MSDEGRRPMRADLDAKGLEAFKKALGGYLNHDDAAYEAAIVAYLEATASGAGEAKARVAKLTEERNAFKEEYHNASRDCMDLAAKLTAAEAELANLRELYAREGHKAMLLQEELVQLRSTPRPPVAGSEVVAEPFGWRWPFVETPGHFTERLAKAMKTFPLLGAVRHVLIENPPVLYASPVPLAEGEVKVADTVFDVIWPQAEWSDEPFCRDVAEKVATALRASPVPLAEGEVTDVMVNAAFDALGLEPDEERSDDGPTFMREDMREAIQAALAALTPAPAGWREALTGARTYVLDALEAHEHSDGRSLLNRIDAMLAAAPLPSKAEG